MYFTWKFYILCVFIKNEFEKSIFMWHFFPNEIAHMTFVENVIVMIKTLLCKLTSSLCNDLVPQDLLHRAPADIILINNYGRDFIGHFKFYQLIPENLPEIIYCWKNGIPHNHSVCDRVLRCWIQATLKIWLPSVFVLSKMSAVFCYPFQLDAQSDDGDSIRNLKNILKWNCNWNSNIFLQEYTFESLSPSKW